MGQQAVKARASVNPIPEGMHTVTPHLVCDGARAAIEFYKKAFGAVESGKVPAPQGDKLLHAQIRIGDSMVMLVDELPGCDTASPISLKGTPVTIHLYVKDVDAVFKQAVNAGATEKMPPTDMFWGDRYAVITDPFGHSWSIATHIHDYTPEEIQKAAEQFCQQS